MKRYAILGLGAVVALVGIVVAVGYLLPVRHRAIRSVVLPAAPEAVYALIADIERYPAWRRGLTALERVPPVGSMPRYREVAGRESILYELTVDQGPHRRVTRIADPTLPFGGQWTYELVPEGSGTRLRITEDGEVYNPVFRFVSRFVMGHSHSLEGYLEDVAKRSAVMESLPNDAARPPAQPRLGHCCARGLGVSSSALNVHGPIVRSRRA